LYISELQNPENLKRSMSITTILPDVRSIIEKNVPRDEKLQAICELLDREVDVFDWTGFYLASKTEEKMLDLGPFVGESTNHTRIPYGTGICGQAAETLNTFVIQDVSQSDNYLACSANVKSEIVVPLMKDGEFVGELDIDSHKKDAITPELRKLCEDVCKEIETIF